ncbi:MAG TPA: tetratricopeptide repeat protein [Thermoanaerobaculia bacterium]|nr:tetratricopeptide repeat protein [Thermoanaerobaculia bacterium]
MSVGQPSPYRVYLSLRPRGEPDAGRELYDLTLADQSAMRVDTVAGVANLSVADSAGAGNGTSQATFLARFLEDRPTSLEAALGFGRWLLGRLFEDAPLAAAWERIEKSRSASRRPLRLLLVLPAGSLGRVADLPFELLADDKGFLFQRFGAALVRSVEGVAAAELRLEKDERAGIAWANPVVDGEGGRLPEAVFHRHEEALQRLAGSFQLRAVPPLRQASLPMLEGLLDGGQAISLLSVIAHGDALGGSLLLHQAGHPDYPGDPGEPVDADAVARLCARAGTKVVLLWSCYGGRRHRLLGALAERLLDPEQGNATVVLTSHASLDAQATTKFSQRLVESLAGVAAGNLEQAVAEARFALPEEDPHWAALAYYARSWEPIRLGAPLPEAPASEAAAGVIGELEEAPAAPAHFRGREEEIERGVALLHHHRLVSFQGMPGIGKTELALAVARQAVTEGSLGLERALWLPLRGLHQAASLRGRLAARWGMERCESDEELARKVGDTAALVVLDNCEDLITADRPGLRALLETLLLGCRRLRLLLSSRKPLGPLGGLEEQMLRPGPLAAPVDREVFLAAAGPRVAPEEATSPDLDRLLELLAGHPLSICLVAGQTGLGLSFVQLTDRIRRDPGKIQGLELFDEELRDDQANQLRDRSLRASIQVSVEPLRRANPAAAELFAWLGHFPAGLSASLLPGIFGGDAAERMAALERAYLAERYGRDERLRLLEPIRLLARQEASKLSPERREQLLTASWQALAAWLSGTYQHQLGTTATARAVARALTEQPNLEALLEELRNAGEGVAAVLACAETVAPWSRILSFAGGAGTAKNLLDATHQMAGALASGSRAEATTAQALGDLYVRTARLREAEDAYQTALPIYQEIQDRLGEANTRQALGDLYVRTDRLREAEHAYQTALPIYQEIQARLGEANTLSGLGRLRQAQGDAAEAFALFRQALVLHRAIENRLGEAAAYGYMARVALAAGRADRAVVLAGVTLATLWEIEDRFGQRLALDILAQAFAALEEHPGFLAAWHLAWMRAMELEDPSAGARVDALKQMWPAFDPAAPVTEEDVQGALGAVLQAVRAQAEAMEKRGEDPLGPLEPGAETG